MSNQEKKLLFSIKNLRKYFPLKKKFLQRRQYYVHANENISLDIYEGETLGLVGESGSGKSTFGRTILQIYEQTEGTTLYYGSELADINPAYVRSDLKNLPKLFNEFKKEQHAYNELLDKEEEAAKGDEDDYHALLDQMMQMRRKIQNDYYNILRLAGGLLVADDLNEISNLLLNEYQAKVDLTQNRKKYRENNWKLDHEDFVKSHKALAEEQKKLDADLPSLEAKLAEESKKVEAKRQELSSHEDYDKFEENRDDGVDLSRLKESEMRELRKDMQIIFQDPYSSLDTRMTLGNIIGEGVMAHNMFPSNKSEGYVKYIQDTMEECGLSSYFIYRYPHQFSGGQRQRIGIARALALEPKFIVCDEAVSALDVSIQSQIINLLQDLKRDKKLTYLFITHDLSVVKYISDRIAVMYLGMVVELSDSEELFKKPLHPYTAALMAAIPRTDVDGNMELAILEGDIPSAVNPPEGCRFHTRCRYCMSRCEQFEPDLNEVEPKRFVACHLMDMPKEEREKWMHECDEREKARLHELTLESERVNKKMIKDNS